MDFVNEKECVVVTLRRSGNHAIMSWIIKQITDINGNDFFARGNTKIGQDPMSLHSLIPEPYPKINKKLLIYNYEDENIKKIFCDKFIKKREEWVGKSKEKYHLLILRDPFNHFASRMKCKITIRARLSKMLRKKPKKYTRLWIDYAKEFLGETNFLPYKKICINYNKWFDDLEYRKRLCIGMNIRFTDAGINSVPQSGDGSSFDGVSYDGRGSEMKVLDRYHYLRDNDFYKKLFTDELLEYAFQIWDEKDFDLSWLG